MIGKAESILGVAVKLLKQWKTVLGQNTFFLIALASNDFIWKDEFDATTEKIKELFLFAHSHS